jgi:hypothetical protein
MTNTPTEIIKRDHNFWYPHIENCERAGISGRKYCRENNLVISQFAYWRLKHKKENSEFIGVKIASKNETRCLCSLELSRGQRLLIHDSECLHMLLQILKHIG